MNNERYSRQSDLVPMGRLSDCNVTVIGVGAVGRQVALQLSAMGVSNLHLIDHDHVEISNLASQGYYEADLEQPKVEATGKVCRAINSEINLVETNGRFRRSQPVGNVIFCCVDKIDTRRSIWNALHEKIDFFVDGRMSGETLRVITASQNNQRSMDNYPETLFAQEEAHAGRCTAKSTIYCANIAAGQMVSKFALWLRGIPAEHDILLNLISDELIVSEENKEQSNEWQSRILH